MKAEAPQSIQHLYQYRVYGLRIGSAVPLPELGLEIGSRESACVDLELVLGIDAYGLSPLNTVLSLDNPDGNDWLRCSRTNEGYRLSFSELAEFLVDRLGRRVTCLAGSVAPPETVRHLFLDQVLPLVLNLRGTEALHASGVEAGGGVCAFMGMSGRGKSTLAAAFHSAGHRVLSDDCLVLKDDPERVLVEYAYPGLRLWNDSREFIFGDSAPSQAVTHYNDKRRVATSGHVAKPGARDELRGIYTPQRADPDGPGREPEIVRLSKRDALMELISCAFRLDLADQAMILRQMRVLERVARRVPVKRLKLPDGFAAIPLAREMILRDLEQG